MPARIEDVKLTDELASWTPVGMADTAKVCTSVRIRNAGSSKVEVRVPVGSRWDVNLGRLGNLYGGTLEAGEEVVLQNERLARYVVVVSKGGKVEASFTYRSDEE
jgi:hypothetical protein